MEEKIEEVLRILAREIAKNRLPNKEWTDDANKEAEVEYRVELEGKINNILHPKN